MDRKKIIAAAAAAGVAGAAGVVVATRKALGGSGPTPDTTYHVAPDGGGWTVKSEGAARAASRHDTKAAALDAGRSLARGRKGSLVIHGSDGAVQRAHRYDDA